MQQCHRATAGADRCEDEPLTLYRGKPWWDVPENGFTLTLTVDEPLIIKDNLQQPMPIPRAARALTTALRDHFERRLKSG